MLKKMKKFGLLVVCVLFMLAIAVACEKTGETPGGDEPAAVTVALSESELTLTVGEEHTLTATVSPEDADVSIVWSSATEAVATVSETGVVRGVSEGTAVITATAGEAKASCTVTVEEETVVPAAPVITVGESAKTVQLSGGRATYTLDYTVEPAATPVTVTCDKESGVELDGKVATFTAVGQYVFTVKAENAGGSDTKTVTVTVEQAPAPEFTVEQTDLSATLQTAQHPSNCTLMLDYAVEGASDLAVTLEETTSIGGWTFDAANKTIRFVRGGEFDFVLTATDENGEDECTFKATVKDEYAESATADISAFWGQTFNSTEKPEGWNEEQSKGDGKVAWTENGVEVSMTEGSSAFINSDFGSPIDGIVEFTVDFRMDASLWNAETGAVTIHFANIFFLINGDKSIVTVAINDNRLIVNEGSGWIDIPIFDSAKTRVVPGEDYTLRAVVDCNAERLYLYLSGEHRIADDASGASGNIADLGENIYLGNFDFRNNGVSIASYRAGGNNGAPHFTIQSIQAKQLTGVVAVEASKDLELIDESVSYVLSYTASEDAKVSIGCDQTDGFTMNGDQVTFTKTGLYTFTITAENDFGSATATVVVNVVTPGKPQFTKEQADLAATLQTAQLPDYCTLALDYAVTGRTDLVVTLNETTSIGGWTFDEEENLITFTRGGSYEFELKAADGSGETACTFRAEITDLYPLTASADAPVIWEQQFNSTSKPEGWTETIGSASVDTITYTEEGVTIHKDKNGISAFLQYDFDQALSGVVEFTIEFKTKSTGFVNLFFLRGSGNNYPVTVSIQNNILQVRESDSWNQWIGVLGSTKTRLVPGEKYTLRAVVDCTNERVYLYLSGKHHIADGQDGGAGENAVLGDNIYLCNFDFRANGEQALAYRMGSDIQNAESDFTVYSIVAKQLSA